MSDFASRLASVPILLFTGSNDAFNQADDFANLVKQLPKTSQVVHIDDYNHLDYMWGDDTNNFVNYAVFTFLEGLSSSTNS